MRETTGKACVLAVAVFGLAAVVGATGCSPAEAEPLQVTYYYLPG